jgi:hypothetical protein
VRRARTFLTVVAAGAVAAIGAAGVADAAIPGFVYGGGAVPDRAPRIDRAAFVGSTAIGLGVSAARDAVAVRVSLGMACARVPGGWSSDDFVVRAALAPGGTFAVERRVRSDELGVAVTVAVSGTIAAERADGTASVRASSTCRSGARAWTARRIDLLHPPEGEPAPVPGSTLYGITNQSDDAPHGERRHHIDSLWETRIGGRFAGTAVVGTASLFDRYREPGYSERCTAGPYTLIAVP